jgi:hypothetical protein
VCSMPGWPCWRATKEANLAGCQSAIHVCNEIESKNRPFHTDTVIVAWQTMGSRAVPSAPPASQSRLSDP